MTSPSPSLVHPQLSSHAICVSAAAVPASSSPPVAQERQAFSIRTSPGGASSPWRRAQRLLTVMLRNATAITAVAWATAYFSSRGNLFGLRAPRNQSQQEFVLGNVMLMFSFVSVCDILTVSQRLLSMRFIALQGNQSNNKKPGLLYCVKRVATAASPHFAFSATLMFALSFVCTSLLPASLDKFKLIFYVLSLLKQYTLVVCEVVMRRIYRHETIEGTQKKNITTTTTTNTTTNTSAGGAVAAPKRRNPKRPTSLAREIFRGYCKSSPIWLSALAAGGYVHLASQMDLSTSSEATVFVGCSLLFKLVLQEAAKQYLQRTGVTQLRHMCVIVGVPTVLVDTQVRVVVLCRQATQSTFIGSIVLAVVEISTRIAKTLLVRAVIRRKERQQQRQHLQDHTTDSSDAGAAAGSNAVRSPRLSRVLTAAVASVHTTPPRLSKGDLEKWKRQTLDLHTAESCADMYAEYIAIGCSAAIAYFYVNNPHYHIGVSSDGQSASATAVSSSSSSSTSSAAQFEMIAVQLAIELVVDYFSSVVEILGGTFSHEIGKLNTFLLFYFAMLAVTNINTSALLYMKTK